MFSILASISIWWLSSQVNSAGGMVKSASIENSQEREELGVIKVIGEKISEALPEPVKKQVEEISEKVFKRSTQVIEETAVVQEIKSTIEKATEEVEGFPEKQKKDLKKEVVKQVCQELMEEME